VIGNHVLGDEIVGPLIIFGPEESVGTIEFRGVGIEVFLRQVGGAKGEKTLPAPLLEKGPEQCFHGTYGWLFSAAKPVLGDPGARKGDSP
jgi:hypothetical protein